MDIQEYIQLVEKTKSETVSKLDNFVALLHKVEEEPELILTNFFSGIDNTILYIAHFNSAVNSEAMLPLIRTLDAFSAFDLKASGYESLAIHFKDQAGYVVSADMKRKSITTSWKVPPKPTDLEETRYEKTGVLLDNFISKRNLRNAYALRHNPYCKYKIHFIDLFKTKLLERAAERVHEATKARIESNRSTNEYYQQRTELYKLYNPDVQKIIGYFKSLGYTVTQY